MISVQLINQDKILDLLGTKKKKPATLAMKLQEFALKFSSRERY